MAIRRTKKKQFPWISVSLAFLLVVSNLIWGFITYQEGKQIDELTLKAATLEVRNGDMQTKITELETTVHQLELDNADLTQQLFTLVDTAAPEDTGNPEDTEKEADHESNPDIPDIGMMNPGDILQYEDIEGHLADFFQAYEITEGDAVYNRIIGKSYYANDNIGLGDIRYLRMVHYNFNHEIQVGEMIVNARIVDLVFGVFQELFENEYEIQSMYLVDNYWTGDADSTDSASIDVNNTSAFCYRHATGSGNLSRHAFGCAIDLNPQQNPYVFSDGHCSHSNAYQYLDRSCGDPHVVVKGDLCYNIFTKYGFSWGGEWSGPIDYQHFQIYLDE